MAEKDIEKAAEAAAEETTRMASAVPKRKKKKLVILAAVVAVIAIAGAGMLVWHEQPTFCSTLCHIEQTYVDNMLQEQGVSGVDKYGNEVSNTNAIMAVLHHSTKATAKPEIVCVDCHKPNMFELAHDGLNYVTGSYPMPRDERTLTRLQSWDKKTQESFCANENCHVYLLGDDGELSYKKLEDSTAGREFNFHAQHHENLTLECNACHKGHRASTVICTGCHQHENVKLPEGWLTYEESQELMKQSFAA